MGNPEQRAREEIDRLLRAAGWAVQDVRDTDIHSARGVAVRVFPLNPGHDQADFLLNLDAKACGVVEGKKQGSTLKSVEVESDRYSHGLPAALPARIRPPPFLYDIRGGRGRPHPSAGGEPLCAE